MIWAAIWYWLLVIFTAADIITTKIWLSHGAMEANPFMAPVIDHIIPIKIGFLLIMAVVVISVERSSKGYGWLPVASASAVTFIAVLNNIILLL
jgi:hypothetical protein